MALTFIEAVLRTLAGTQLFTHTTFMAFYSEVNDSLTTSSQAAYQYHQDIFCCI